MNGNSAFSRGTVIWLVAVAGLSFGGAGWFALEDTEPRRAFVSGPGTRSSSAIGHRAFVDLLERAGTHVRVRRRDLAEEFGAFRVLVLLEPRPDRFEADELSSLGAGRAALVVLPKWTGAPHPERPDWIDSATLLPTTEVGAVLRKLTPRAMVYRPTLEPRWKSVPFGARPELIHPQLMLGSDLTPVMESDRGMLVAAIGRGEQRIWIVSDPDLLSNHGISRGDNAVLAHSLVEALLPPGGTVLIDESMHMKGGLLEVPPPSLRRALTEPPFVAVTVLFLAAVAVLVLAAAGRFGAPQPAPRALAFGHAALLDNMARLLASGRHGREILRRYHELVKREVLRRVHAPAQENEDALAARLDRASEARGAAMPYSDLRDTVDAALGKPRTARATVVSLGRDLHRWKGDILDGR